MSITDITKKITEEASEKASDIIKQSEKEVQEVEASIEKEISEAKEKHSKELERILSENERNVRSVALREVKLSLEKARRDALDGVYKDALEKLRSLPEGKYEDILKGLLKTVNKETKGVIYCPKNREKDTKKVVEGVGLKCDIVPKDGILGGVIFEGDNFEYDLTFEHMLNTQKDKIETEVAEMLFK